MFSKYLKRKQEKSKIVSITSWEESKKRMKSLRTKVLLSRYLSSFSFLIVTFVGLKFINTCTSSFLEINIWSYQLLDIETIGLLLLDRFVHLGLQSWLTPSIRWNIGQFLQEYYQVIDLFSQFDGRIIPDFVIQGKHSQTCSSGELVLFSILL